MAQLLRGSSYPSLPYIISTIILHVLNYLAPPLYKSTCNILLDPKFWNYFVCHFSGIKRLFVLYIKSINYISKICKQIKKYLVKKISKITNTVNLIT